MKLSRVALVWTLLLAGLATAGFLFFFEYHTEEIDRGFGPEARRNPYLAAEQFLDRIDIPHRRADNISVLSSLAENEVLLLTSSSQVYNSDRVWELLNWIERGGRAIVVAHTGSGDNERDFLLEMLGVELAEGDLDLYFNDQVREVFGDDAADIQNKSLSEILREHNRKLTEKEDVKKKGSEGESSGSESGENESVADTSDATADNAPQPPRNPDIAPERLLTLSNASGTEYTLYPDPAWVFARDEYESEDEDEDEQPSETQQQGDDALAASHLLQWVTFPNRPDEAPLIHYDYGQGRLTLMTDSGLWRNHRIGHFDHAYFLAQLIDERPLVMVTHPHFDGLGTLIRRYAPELSIAGLLALLAWILNRSRRFGPLTPEPPRERRSLLEHIRASGHFYWRQSRAHQLYEQARAPLLQKATRLSPQAARQLPLEKQRHFAQSIAEQTGLGAGDIFSTLWDEPPRNEDDFTARMRRIQIIEAAL